MEASNKKRRKLTPSRSVKDRHTRSSCQRDDTTIKASNNKGTARTRSRSCRRDHTPITGSNYGTTCPSSGTCQTDDTTIKASNTGTARTRNHSCQKDNTTITASRYDVTCLEHRDDIYVRTPEDESECWILGMTTLPADRLVLTDWYNKSIRLVDVDSGSVISQLSLGTENEDRPYDITTITSSQVAITVPLRRCIQFITVTDKLIVDHTIKTDSECFGLCCYQNKLIVTQWMPEKVQILDLKGSVITAVKTDAHGKDIFNKPTYIQANSGAIFVSDEGWDNVIKFNWQGEVTGRFRKLGVPQGLTLLGNGSLLACDNNGNRVCQILDHDSDCRNVLKVVANPQAICVDEGGGKLYISRATSDNDQNNSSILAFNVKPNHKHA